jgi:hypothetical protein
MVGDIVKQFMGSGDFQQVVSDLTSRGLSPDQARRTVEATAEGAAQHLGESGGGLGGLLGKLGGLFGGGGTGGLPANVVDEIANAVASRVGIDPTMAKMAVAAILPKLVAYVKGKASAGVGA